MLNTTLEEKKALTNLVEKLENTEIVNEEMASASLRIAELYQNVIEKYLELPVVIQFNYLEDLKKRSMSVKSLEEFKVILESDLKIMKEKQNKSRIELIEYGMARKVYRDVVQGRGKEKQFTRDIKVHYDGQEIRFAGFFDEKAIEEANKNLQKKEIQEVELA